MLQCRFSLTEGSGSVLGANTIRGHDVFFDIPEASRIGFAPSDCDYFHLIGEGDDDIKDVETNKREVDGGDDYYAEDTQKDIDGEPEFPSDMNDDDILHPDSGMVFENKLQSPIFVGVASLAIVGLVSVMIVSVVRRCRNVSSLTSDELERADLNDLHLDTEIERLPAIA